MMPAMSWRAATCRAWSGRSSTRGTIRAARMPMMTMTTMISIRVNPAGGLARALTDALYNSGLNSKTGIVDMKYDSNMWSARRRDRGGRWRHEGRGQAAAAPPCSTITAPRCRAARCRARSRRPAARPTAAAVHAEHGRAVIAGDHAQHADLRAQRLVLAEPQRHRTIVRRAWRGGASAGGMAAGRGANSVAPHRPMPPAAASMASTRSREGAEGRAGRKDSMAGAARQGASVWRCARL